MARAERTVSQPPPCRRDAGQRAYLKARDHVRRVRWFALPDFHGSTRSRQPSRSSHPRTPRYTRGRASPPRLSQHTGHRSRRPDEFLQGRRAHLQQRRHQGNELSAAPAIGTAVPRRQPPYPAASLWWEGGGAGFGWARGAPFGAAARSGRRRDARARVATRARAHRKAWSLRGLPT